MSINLASFPPDAELFNEEAERVANRLAQAARHLNKSTQIRRFYDELVGWQERIAGDDGKFEQYLAFIRMLNAKVAYAKGRGLVDGEFETWFRGCLKATTSARALDHFRLHFEAVLGFLKALRP
ncbi:MAG: type III-A CRISPR-associated protein Csm2 [Candidatus Accumulibacter phosphatis]|mgnify:CR=1 FL=1|jgi:CRISPR-associated protein Csm2|uniref:CRISPR system Cms protein Csm2 n=2 Tax=Candidatus Accumulibacter TaxID=327159 RepID=A0A6A7RPE8_9PROT|nr:MULTISPECIES: type III-A CRISPR-associated protein Csm2 [Candidatus Accumulibacter]MQM29080.1 type III-A CRISPR-associated protein Csm2 [Candidatus Accumulibacter phosphatis]NMQ29191.1 type III-A CRISPR-associated protein Csm2 [Candidatus Accumulibacter phosphatis]RDE50643.1 MAG: type III-A CRISPR-associated protein Csm2 [Candidatus Accumulibacter meliphilus]